MQVHKWFIRPGDLIIAMNVIINHPVILWQAINFSSVYSNYYHVWYMMSPGITYISNILVTINWESSS